METLLADLRYGARMLARSPLFTVAAVLALALGIGANTAIFSLINTVLLRPLPYRDPGRLVKLWTQFTGIGLPNDQNWFSAPEFADLRSKARSLSHAAVYRPIGMNFSAGGGMPERIDGAAVSTSLFPMLGVEAQLGRVFLPEEDATGRQPDVVLISHGLWQRRFGGDRTVVGRKVFLSGRGFTIAGVLPPGFQYPDEAEIWTPLAFSSDDLSPNRRGNHGLQVLARVKPELSLEQARADLKAAANGVTQDNPQYPYAKFNFTFLMTPLLEEMVGDIRTALWILMGAVGFVLLIACANVANLMLARASAREKEIAVRAALGAGRARLIRQMLTESVLLSLVGGLAGLALAYWGLRVLVATSATILPRVAQTQLDGWVLAYTMGISLATGLLFGLAPAWQASGARSQDALKEGGRGASAGTGAQRLRRLLVVGEIALSLVLLAGAGLLIKSFLRLQQVDAGFRPENVLTMVVSLPTAKYGQQPQWRSFFRDLMERVRRLPGVQSAGAVSVLPTTGNSSGTVTVDTAAVPPDQTTPEADQRPVLPGYFETMGIALIRGRYLDERDTETSQPVAVIDETMAKTYWPNDDPVGRRIKRSGRQSTNPWLTVVGVVKHVRNRTLEAASRVQLYWPHAQNPSPTMSLTLRTTADPRPLGASVQRQVLDLDPDQPVYRVRTMEEVLAESMARRRLSMLLLGIFAGVALLLAGVGIYSLMSWFVTQRAHELGIRMALGAGRLHLLRMVVGQSLVLTLAGISLGLAGSAMLAGLMSTLLFHVKASDPPTFLLVALTLVMVGLAASYLPARRATQVDPIHALRQE